MPARYQVDVSDSAEQDIEGILDWTIDKFGAKAERRYRGLIEQALRDLQENPGRPEARQISELPPGTFAYHLAFSRERLRSALGVVKRPRHFVIYRVEGAVVRVLRILHDMRDLGRHLSEPA